MMHPYIPHLLEDILAAHQAEKRKAPKSSITDPTRAIEEIVQKLEECGHDLGYYCGLSAEQFPPAAQLNTKEMKLVCQALKKMMLSWRLKCVLPKNLPPRLTYILLIKLLDHEIYPDSDFDVSFKYCSGNPAACELKKYCTCLRGK